MSWTRRIALFLGLALLVAAIGYGFVPRAPLVDAVPIAQASFQVTVREEGQTRVKDRYVLSAPVPGYAQRLRLEVGDTVEAGETILEIDPLRSSLLDPRTRAEASARVSAAEAQLQVAQQRSDASASDAALAKSELERVSQMQREGTATDSDLDRARADHRAKAAIQRSAAFAVDVTRYELQAAQAALHYAGPEGPGTASGEQVQVRSPLRAKVLRRFHESEGAVPLGERLLELGDPAALEVQVEVLSADAVRIRPEMRVVLDRWGGEPLEGRVRVVEPIGFTKVSALGVEEQRVLVIVDILSPPERWTSLGDGYRIEATFVLWEGADVLQVPNSALFRAAGRWQAYVYEEGRARLRTLTLGQRNGLYSQVTAGLSPGERVLTHPSDQVTDGAALRLRD